MAFIHGELDSDDGLCYLHTHLITRNSTNHSKTIFNSNIIFEFWFEICSGFFLSRYIGHTKRSRFYFFLGVFEAEFTVRDRWRLLCILSASSVYGGFVCRRFQKKKKNCPSEKLSVCLAKSKKKNNEVKSVELNDFADACATATATTSRTVLNNFWEYIWKFIVYICFGIESALSIQSSGPVSVS